MPSKIKVLHIIKSLGRGGAETLLPETLKLHDQNQFEFHYIYFLPWKDQMVSEIVKNGGKVSCLSSRNNFQIVLKSRAVAKYMKQNNIQLVHCHLPWAGLVGRIIHTMTGAPVIYTEHNKQERYHFLTRWMNRITFNRQSCAIAVSNDVAESIKKNIKPAVPVHEITNGINTGSFQRDRDEGRKVRMQLGIPENSIVIGTIAVFRFQKRLPEWLEVFQKASAKHPNIYGIIVGDGPLKEDILLQRKKLRIEQRVIMPGLQQDVKPWLSAMDIFMMTSNFEGLPVALLEAMSMQCAIVTTDAGGIREVIRHAQDGLMVKVENWNDLADELEKVITDEAKKSTLGIAARKRVAENYSMKKMVKELEELYQGLPVTSYR